MKISPAGRLALLPLMIGLAAVVPGLLLSLLAGSDNPRLALSQISSAAVSDNYILGTPVRMLDVPAVVLEKGIISILAPSAPRSHKSSVSARVSLALDDATFLIESPGTGHERSEGPSGAGETSALLRALSTLNFEHLNVRRATVQTRNEQGAVALFGLIDADVAMSSRSGITAKGTLERSGEKLGFDVTLALPSGRKKDGPLALTANLTGKFVSAELSGQLVRGKDLSIEANRATVSLPKLKDLMKWLGAAQIDAPGFNTFDAKGRMEWHGRSVDFEQASFTIDGNAAKGSLSVDFSGSRPSIEGTLAFSTLDLEPYLSGKRNEPAIASAVGWRLPEWGPWPDASPISIARQFDADLRISASEVTSNGTGIGRGAATFSLSNERLNIGITDLQLTKGGEGEGQFSVDLIGSAPRYEVRGEMRGIETALLPDVILKLLPVSGLGTLKFDVSASGANDDELTASVSGRMRIDVRENASVGLDLAALMSGARTGVRRDWGALWGRKQSADAISIAVSALAGTLTTEVAEASVGGARFVAAGSIDISRRMLDLELTRIAKAVTDKSPSDSSGPETVRIKGPWAEPELRSIGPGNRS